MRSETAFFSAAVIGRRFLSGLAPDLLSAEAAVATFLVEEDRREVERAAGVDAPRICSASVNVLISAWRRSISLCRSAIACAMSLMGRESTGLPRGCQTLWGMRFPRMKALSGTIAPPRRWSPRGRAAGVAGPPGHP